MDILHAMTPSELYLCAGAGVAVVITLVEIHLNRLLFWGFALGLITFALAGLTFPR